MSPVGASSEACVRPLEVADLPEAAVVSAAAFGLDFADAAAAARWRQRVAYGVQTDPDGTFVAARDGRIIGVAQALQRERLDCLSLLTAPRRTERGRRACADGQRPALRHPTVPRA